MLALQPTYYPKRNHEIRFPKSARVLGAILGDAVGGGRHELCLFGGNANNGTNSGPFYVNSNNAFSNSNTNYGSRLTNLSILINLVLSPIATERGSLPNHDPIENLKRWSDSVGVGYSEVKKSRKRKGLYYCNEASGASRMRKHFKSSGRADKSHGYANVKTAICK